MRLLNIETGYLKFVNFDYKIEYIAISHRWLKNELSLSKIGLIGLGDNTNIGNKLYEHLNSKIRKCSPMVNNIQSPINENKDIEKYKKWNDYLNFFNNSKDINKENVNDHYKLINIINSIINNTINNKNIKYIWIDTLCIDKSNNDELNKSLKNMFDIYISSFKVNVYLCDKYNHKIEKDLFEFIKT